MFGHRIKLFKLLGFEVHIDLTWIFLALLIVWTLALGFFPMYVPGLSSSDYWIMSILGALGLFLSIILHELCHSLVARQYGLPIKGITLFIFGGVAEMHEEPKTPKGEFLMAIAGPICSFVIAGFAYLLFFAGSHTNWIPQVQGVLYYLALINFILAVFNMLPAFPLDGGRVLRSILWWKKGDIRWATRIASRIGSGFGIVLIALGIFSLFAGNIIAAIWWALIGMFLRTAAQGSYQHILMRDILSGEPLSRVMNEQAVTISPDITVKDFIEDYVYRYHHKMFPVMEDGHLSGCMNTSQIKNLPREQWNEKHIKDIVKSCSNENTVTMDHDAAYALAKMMETGNNRLLVTDHDKLQGIVTMNDIMKFLSLKMDLEGYQTQPKWQQRI